MIIEDVQPQQTSNSTTAFHKMQQLHHATKLTTITPRFNHTASVKPPANLPKLVLRATKAAKQAQQPASVVATKVTATRPTLGRRFLGFVQYPLIAALAMGAAYSSTVGQIQVGVYGLIAILLRLDSKFTFGASLLLLISIPSFQALHQTGVSEKCAIYTYELLVVGTVQAIIETWVENRASKTDSI